MEWTDKEPMEVGWYWAVWLGRVYMVEIVPDYQPKDGCVNIHGYSDFGHNKYEFTAWMGPIPKPEPPILPGPR